MMLTIMKRATSAAMPFRGMMGTLEWGAHFSGPGNKAAGTGSAFNGCPELQPVSDLCAGELVAAMAMGFNYSSIMVHGPDPGSLSA
jgi:hypothetical protein